MVNGKKASEYITRTDLFDAVYAPIKLCQLKDAVYFEVQVIGSGESSQVSAIAHGLARAIALKDDAQRAILKSEGMLTRDARKVERKKPGRHKARKGMQWSKR
jgi:small subunit ribosomal protein S9